MTDEFATAIIGYPSRPHFVRVEQGGPQEDRVFFAYHDPVEPIINAAAEPGFAGGPDFFDALLNVVPNIIIGNGETYFSQSDLHLAGEIRVGPTPVVAMLDEKVAYVVYHDIDGGDLGDEFDDRDFDIILWRGFRDFPNEHYDWSGPWEVNTPDSDVRSDQFLPAIVADGSTLHVVWFDTRDDLRGPNEDVKIAFYYQQFSDPGRVPGDPSYVGNNVILDAEAIDTSSLTNPRFLGDYIDIVMTPAGGEMPSVPVAIYLRTTHPRFVPPGFGSQGEIPGTAQEDEAILFCNH